MSECMSICMSSFVCVRHRRHRQHRVYPLRSGTGRTCIYIHLIEFICSINIYLIEFIYTVIDSTYPYTTRDPSLYITSRSSEGTPYAPPYAPIPHTSEQSSWVVMYIHSYPTVCVNVWRGICHAPQWVHPMLPIPAMPLIHMNELA